MWARENMLFIKGRWLKILLALIGIFLLSGLSSAMETKAANASFKSYHGKPSVLKKLKKVFSVGFHSKSKTTKTAKLPNQMLNQSTTQSSKKKNFLLSKSASMASPLTRTTISDNDPILSPKKIDSGCWNGPLEHVGENKLQATLESSDTVYVVGVLDDTNFQLRLIEITDYGGDYILFEKFYKRDENLDDLLDILKNFCQASKVATGQYSKPKLFMLIVPEYVNGGIVEISNPDWQLNVEALSWNLHVDDCRILNNFEAIGHYLSKVPKKNVVTMNNVEPPENGPAACFGDRSDGFGGAFLATKIGDKQLVFPSDLGHTDFKSRNQLELELHDYICVVHEVKRVTIGHVLSGQGLQFVYAFMKHKHAEKASQEVENLLAQPGANKVEIITDHALEDYSNRDWLCEQALDLWVSIYGSAVFNFALMSPPFGGIYIDSQNKKALLNKQALFMSSFEEKPIENLQSIPVYILDQDMTFFAAEQISREYFPEITEDDVDEF